MADRLGGNDTHYSISVGPTKVPMSASLSLAAVAIRERFAEQLVHSR